MASKGAVAQDLAFADTVVAMELEGIPSSRRSPADVDALEDDRSGSRRKTAPGVWSRTREEMHELWNAAAEVAPVKLSAWQRVRTIWSFFEWERGDWLRAISIGAGTFLVFAVLAAFVVLR